MTASSPGTEELFAQHLLDLWRRSEGLAREPSRAAILAEVEGWLREGEVARVRDAVMVIAWWAGPALAPVVVALAARAQADTNSTVKVWLAHGLRALVLANVDIEAAFSALFSMLADEPDPRPFAVASFALSVAHRQGASFAAVADDAARTLSVRWESAEIYADLLTAGFVPPPHHQKHLLALLSFSDEKRRAPARQGLALFLARGDDLSDFVSEVAKGLGGKTAKALEAPLRAAGALIAAGVSMAPFLAPIERALASKTTAVRYAAHRMFDDIAAHGAPESLLRDEQAAREGGFEKVALLLSRGVIREPVRPAPAPRPSPPPLDLAGLAVALRSDNLTELRGALYCLPRADRDQLLSLLPALMDVLGTEERVKALDQLTRALSFTGPEAIDLRFALPVVAGLLLDRDYYDQMTLAAILGFLMAALGAGYDIALAWPWIPTYLDGGFNQELRLQLGKKALAAGLDGRAWETWLRRSLTEPKPDGHPDGAYTSMKCAGLAAECLVLMQRQGAHP